jgi:hypothetical protein
VPSASVAVGALLLASCASTGTGTGTGAVRDRTASPRVTAQAPSLPAATSVANGRFISPVQLDDGTLRVEPPGPGEHPRLSEAEATKIWATSTLAGYRAGSPGFGMVTINLRQAGVPSVTSLLAWIAFAMANAASCPAETVPTGPTTTQLDLPSSGYAAVVIGAAIGTPAVVYTARSSTCGFPPTGPTVTTASEVVSIPWVALGTVQAGELAVRASVPSCGTYRGASVGGNAKSLTVTLLAVVPDVAHECPVVQPVTESVQVGPPNAPGAPPPVVSPSTLIGHGSLGAIRAVS